MATIKSVLLKNFRGYKNETVIPFESMTVFVGRNDIGKSTVLEAPDLRGHFSAWSEVMIWLSLAPNQTWRQR